jgi:hypothetical protein
MPPYVPIPPARRPPHRTRSRPGEVSTPHRYVTVNDQINGTHAAGAHSA